MSSYDRFEKTVLGGCLAVGLICAVIVAPFRWFSGDHAGAETLWLLFAFGLVLVGSLMAAVAIRGRR